MGAEPTRPRIDAMFTMLPWPRSIIPSPTCWLRRNSPSRLTAIVERHRSMVSSSAGVVPPTPALLTSTSTWPATASAASARAMTESSSAMSAGTTTTRSPSSAASSSRRSARRAATTTVAPAPCRTRANRRPSPDEAPVTTATWPSSEKSPDTSIVVMVARVSTAAPPRVQRAAARTIATMPSVARSANRSSSDGSATSIQLRTAATRWSTAWRHSQSRISASST